LVAVSESSWLSLSPELNENKKRLHNNYIQWNTHLHWSEHAGSDILHAHYPARKILNAHSRVAGFIKSREWKKSKIWKFDSNTNKGLSYLWKEIHVSDFYAFRSCRHAHPACMEDAILHGKPFGIYCETWSLWWYKAELKTNFHSGK
jgi:hypothetical protein